MNTISLPFVGAIGVDTGAASDGVLFGVVTPAAMGAVVGATKVAASNVSAYTDDGGLYVDDSTDFGDAGTGDVAPLPAAPAVDDAFYVGADGTFARVDFDVSTAGAGTWTPAYEYWNGTAYAALAGVTDPTTGFSAGSTGINSLTFTSPVDWAKNTVDGVNKYWIRIRVSAFVSITTQALLTSGEVVLDDLVEADLTTEANEGTADDVPVTSSYPVVGERLYFGAEDKFCKLKLEVSTAAVGTLTFTWKYYNGTTWAAITTLNDATVDFSEAAGTYFVSFAPPANWTAFEDDDGPDGNNGYFIAAEVATASGAITAPILEQAWTLPMTAAACDGFQIPAGTLAFDLVGVNMNAAVVSGGTTDSHFVLLNAATGDFVDFAWTAADAADFVTIDLAVTESDELVLFQVQEQGTTEFQAGSFTLMGAD